MARSARPSVLIQATKRADALLTSSSRGKAPASRTTGAAGSEPDLSTASPTAFISTLSLRQVLLLGALLRLVLFRWLPDAAKVVLTDRPELSTPLTSFRRLREGVFLLGKGIDPYDGGLVLLSPLQLHFSSVFLPPTSDFLTAVAWTSADLAAAHALARLWTRRVHEKRESTIGRRNWSSVVAFLFLLNPYTILTTLARSMATIDNAIVLLALSSAAEARATLAVLALSLATRMSLYPVLLLPALLLCIPAPPDPAQPVAARVIRATALFVAFLAGLSMLERALAGSWAAVFTNWSVVLGIRDLTPNVGLSWYFFTEMFEQFRTFFVIVFQLHSLIYVVPLCLAFRSDPLFAVLCQLWITTTLQTYPTLGATSLSVGLLPLFPSLIPHISRPLIPIGLHVYASLLFPILHHLWLHAGSANANFFYAAGLVVGLGNILSGVELVWVGRKQAFLRSEGLEGVQGWDAVQVAAD